MNQLSFVSETCGTGKEKRRQEDGQVPEDY